MRLFTSELVKKYKARTVVNHVSIDVNQGEIVGLLGPNGAGKTTTFYMIVGLIKPNEGKIFLEDNEGRVAELTDEPVYRRAQMGVGYLAQEASVFRRLSVEDNIRAVLEMTRFSKEYQAERVEALIKEFRLEKVRKSMGIQLGGERRRTFLEIARRVAINPAFILLDEPFAGVDPIAVEDIQSIVATLKNRISASSSPTTTSTRRSQSPTAPTCFTRARCSKRVRRRSWPPTPKCANAIWASTSNCAAARRSTACGSRVPKRSAPFRKPTRKLRTSSPTRRRTNTYNDRIVKPLRTTLWIDPSRRGRYLLPPARKVTRSAPSRRRFWQRENPHCVTSNCATTPARSCAASRR